MKMIDVAIIGSGPAGLGAALYAARSGLTVTIFEKQFIGGQAAVTNEVDNYLGFADTPSGAELTEKMREHVSKFPVTFKLSAVKRLELDGAVKKIYTSKAEFEAKNVILAMGASPRPLGAADEERLRGRGVSYCATCDGMFFKGKCVAVVGGGDTAVHDALYLSPLCEKVYLIHRRDEFRAAKMNVDRVRALPNVEIVTPATVKELKGDASLSSVVLNTSDGEREIAVSGLFVAVGTIPQTELVPPSVTTENGFIITDENMRTNIDGVYAVGDIRKKSLRQIITAVADGAVAAQSCTMS